MKAIDQAEMLSENAILKAAIKKRNTTQTELADKMGMLRNGLCQNINRPHMTMDKFKEILDALEYDIYIVDRETGKAEWTLDVI